MPEPTQQTTVEPEQLSFEVDGTECIAKLWRPEGEPRSCIVMGNGFSLTQGDGLPIYAERYVAAGCAVSTFDYRFLGESGGAPRQRLKPSDQLADFRAAVAFARTLEGIDPDRIVAWGYSMGGGHAVKLAAADDRLAGLILLCPFLNGPTRMASTKPKTLAWLTPKLLITLAGRQVKVPVTDQPDQLAAMNLPGEADGFASVIPPDSLWRNETTVHAFLTTASHMPWRLAKRLNCPTWIATGDRDITVPGKGAEKIAARHSPTTHITYPVDHFEPFTGEWPDRIAADQISFLAENELAV